MSFFIRKSKSRGGSVATKLSEMVSASSSSSQPHNPRKRSFQQQPQRGRGRKRSAPNGRGPHQNHPTRKEDHHNDDEITSESDDEEDEETKGSQRVNEDDDVSGGDNDEETEQEARVRIAKEQIRELKKKLVERHGEANDLDVGEALREQELVDEGRVLRKIVTDEFREKVMRSDVLVTGNIIKSPLTCVRSTSTHVYASTKSGTLVAYNLSTRTRVHRTLTPSPVTSLAVSDTVVAASTPSAIHLLSPSDLSTLHTFNASRGAQSLCLSSDTLFSTHKDRTVKLWNIPERAYVESLFGHQDVPTCVSPLSGNRIVSSGGFDKTLRVWKIDEESQLVYNWEQNIIDVVHVISGGFFVAGSCDGDIGLFSVGRKKPLNVVAGAHGVDKISGVARWVTAIGGVGDFVATGSDDGVVKVWKVVARKLEFVRDVEVGKGVVIGVNVIVGEGEGDDVRIVVGLGTEMRNGRWGGRKANCSKIICLS